MYILFEKFSFFYILFTAFDCMNKLFYLFCLKMVKTSFVKKLFNNN